jgi:hypothetical protein
MMMRRFSLWILILVLGWVMNTRCVWGACAWGCGRRLVAGCALVLQNLCQAKTSLSTAYAATFQQSYDEARVFDDVVVRRSNKL